MANQIQRDTTIAFLELLKEAQKKDMDIKLTKVRGGSKYMLVPKEINQLKQ